MNNTHTAAALELHSSKIRATSITAGTRISMLPFKDITITATAPMSNGRMRIFFTSDWHDGAAFERTINRRDSFKKA